MSREISKTQAGRRRPPVAVWLSASEARKSKYTNASVAQQSGVVNESSVLSTSCTEVLMAIWAWQQHEGFHWANTHVTGCRGERGSESHRDTAMFTHLSRIFDNQAECLEASSAKANIVLPKKYAILPILNMNHFKIPAQINTMVKVKRMTCLVIAMGQSEQANRHQWKLARNSTRCRQ